MKIITITNWIFIGVYALLIIYTLLGLNRSSGDAASRGLETGFAYIGALVVAALIVLNILPYRFAKITTLILLALPVVISLYHFINQYVGSRNQNQIKEARANGSLYFPDEPRRQLAAAIAAADTVQLHQLLQKQVPQLNESGYQATTLLDFAALRCVTSDAPEKSLRCLEILLEHGATIQGPKTDHKPTHFLICKTGSATLLEWFLKKGVNPNTRPSLNANPILFEVMGSDKDRLEKVKLLLDYGADPNALAANTGSFIKYRYSPLLYAAQEQLWDVCQLLIERGTNPAYRTSQGDDLKKIMTVHEELYADVDDTPATYTVFKKFLENRPAPKR